MFNTQMVVELLAYLACQPSVGRLQGHIAFVEGRLFVEYLHQRLCECRELLLFEALGELLVVDGIAIEFTRQFAREHGIGKEDEVPLEVPATIELTAPATTGTA